MSQIILVMIIIFLIILIIGFTIAMLWYKTDFEECESTQSPYCPLFTCPSSGRPTASSTIDPNTNYGPGQNAIRVNKDNGTVYKDPQGNMYIST